MYFRDRTKLLDFTNIVLFVLHCFLQDLKPSNIAVNEDCELKVCRLLCYTVCYLWNLLHLYAFVTITTKFSIAPPTEWMGAHNNNSYDYE